jgi:hypothetical protein
MHVDVQSLEANLVLFLPLAYDLPFLQVLFVNTKATPMRFYVARALPTQAYTYLKMSGDAFCWLSI